MKRLLFFSFLLVIAAAMVFAGGGQGQTTDSSKTLEITAFEGGYGRVYWDDMVSQFQAAHSDVKINLTIDPEIGTILTARIAAGQWPDFNYIGAGADMIKNHELLDITDVFNSDVPDRPGTKIRDYVIPGTLESSICTPYGDGKIYQAPFNSSPMALVYNKTLFDAKGWKVPATWDELFALGKELDKSENYVTIDGQRVKRALFTYQGIYPSYLEALLWPSIASAGGDAVVNKIRAYEKGSFNVPAVRSALENFQKIGTQGYLMQGTVGLNHTQSQTDMMLGKALFIPNGVWMVNEMADAPREPGFVFAMMSNPLQRAGQKHYVKSNMEVNYIPAAAKNPALAKEFMKSLYTKASVISFAKNAAGVMAVKDARELGKPYLSADAYNMSSVYDDGTFLLMDFETLPDNTRVIPSKVFWDDNMGPLVTGSLSVTDYINRVEESFAEITVDKARN
jgi:N-acetylglucosamine transport system substrate-binding protein